MFFCTQNVSLRLTVVVPWRIGVKNRAIGHVELGCHVDSAKHWSEMLSSPRRAVATWHQLIDDAKE